MEAQSNTLSAREIIGRFGGRDELAFSLGLSEKAVYRWEVRNAIPGAWHLTLLELAEQKSIDLCARDLMPFARQGLV